MSWRRVAGVGSSIGSFTPPLLTLFALALVGCGKASRPASDVRWRPRAENIIPGPPHLRWSVRGRLTDVRNLSWRHDSSAAPLPPSEIEAVIRQALALWEASGIANFAAAGASEADIVFGWRCAEDGTCPVFAGRVHELAHAGPVQRGTFVHFNPLAGFQGGEAGLAMLEKAALHEVGHVLGLGHSLDPQALMYAEAATVPSKPAAPDLAGLHSLYGGGESGPGDLSIWAFDREGRALPAAPDIRGIAPSESIRWTTFDTDGDGADEILLWPCDISKPGDLSVLRFESGPTLIRTDGPYEGITGAGRMTSFDRTSDGVRVMLLSLPDGRYAACLFDAAGIPGETWPAGRPLFLANGQSDADADRRFDGPMGLFSPPVDVGINRGGEQIGSADIDGDGVEDSLWSHPGNEGSRCYRWVFGSRGDGTPKEGPTIVAEELHFADLDGDGRKEAVVRGRAF